MHPKLKIYISDLESDFKSIPSFRKGELKEVAKYTFTKINKDKIAKLNFICTHNSRRSHLAQIWTAVAASHYGLNDIETYSGGTEATAFNPRAVTALERAGFQIENPGGENPRYKVRFDEDSDPMICCSKTFDDPTNPDSGFAAIMTCSDADENCPFVPGAEFRKPITYRDPKESDGTDKETEIYDERCQQIATEMFFMMSLAKGNLK
ncbi:MAG: protein-tyrosine-phosphatase [Bacteroidetes bacterium]|jgi:arsenate reductase|nr:protein-tyrosine-phosphatase [Bacteroidota bacterium]